MRSKQQPSSYNLYVFYFIYTVTPQLKTTKNNEIAFYNLKMKVIKQDINKPDAGFYIKHVVDDLFRSQYQYIPKSYYP